jgi:osmoprotectant transport system ATP-binding protein
MTAPGGIQFTDVSLILPSARLPSHTHSSDLVSRSGTILRNINLSLAAETTTALIGRSGSGKTTLLRMVNGLVQPSGGSVTVNGQAVSNASEEDLINLRRDVGYVIQEVGLYPHMTIERNTAMALELAGEPAAKRRSRAAEMLQMVGLEPSSFAHRYPWQLSGGQRQRVGLARALAADPSILLLDEPFGALDPLTRAEMQDVLLSIQQRLKKTVVIVTHDLQEALYLAERVILVSAGEIVADLPSVEVEASTDQHLREYIAAVHRGHKTPSEPNV